VKGGILRAGRQGMAAPTAGRDKYNNLEAKKLQESFDLPHL